MFRSALLVTALVASAPRAAEDKTALKPPAAKLPAPGSLVADKDREEVILSAVVQRPKGKHMIGFQEGKSCCGFPSLVAGSLPHLARITMMALYDGLSKMNKARSIERAF